MVEYAKMPAMQSVNSVGILPGITNMGYEVEMFFSCKNLKNLDGWTGKSDPFITVSISEGKATNPPKVTWKSDVI